MDDVFQEEGSASAKVLNGSTLGILRGSQEGWSGWGRVSEWERAGNEV